MSENCNKRFYHDHDSLEEFVRALAKATEYRSYDTGNVINTYWKEEAQEWVKELESQEKTCLFAMYAVDLQGGKNLLWVKQLLETFDWQVWTASRADAAKLLGITFRLEKINA